MRARSHAFLPLGVRWINMSLVTDIEDHGEELRLFLTSDMARLAGGTEPTALDVARRISVTDPEEVKILRRWLMINDED